LLFTLSPKCRLRVVSRAGAYTKKKRKKKQKKKKKKKKEKLPSEKQREQPLRVQRTVLFGIFKLFYGKRKNAAEGLEH
jgi:hypothetical protein